jgi:tRNA threonylcarbamoyladenosine biosynthesis protein TsaE
MTCDELTITTTSPEQTEDLGAALAGLLSTGSVAALRGDLAAGKTCLVRGFARGIRSTHRVSSPTFTLVNEYKGDTMIYHLDLYRLNSIHQLYDLGYEELFEPVNAVTVVEWAERAEELLPSQRLDIFLEHGGEETRILRLVNRNCLGADWKESLRSAVR